MAMVRQLTSLDTESLSLIFDRQTWMLAVIPPAPQTILLKSISSRLYHTQVITHRNDFIPNNVHFVFKYSIIC